MDRYVGWTLGSYLLFCVGQVQASGPRDCTGIVSNVERLACFDEAAGTPVVVPRLPVRQIPEPAAPTRTLIMSNEVQRAPGQSGFVMSSENESVDGKQQRVLISAPASAHPHTYLAISCVQNITRLQLLTAQPVETSRVSIGLGPNLGAASKRPWQVMEDGTVIDVGRGRTAIEMVKGVLDWQYIHISSDNALLNGLVFDSNTLAPMINQARTACHW
ncbi:hypothetical protein D3C77_106910 [compost metagenome]|uniref:type VI secretion system-associated protein VasI n=1 Tax=Pseudomonas TaxID=286 RepID=UPI000A06C77C|nr:MULTISPECIES: type VI secretion system-associated protein VasI [Pseudomonas]PRA58176.1 type VI secretion system-associated protein TagO [Pseudomonas sp. MYb187]